MRPAPILSAYCTLKPALVGTLHEQTLIQVPPRHGLSGCEVAEDRTVADGSEGELTFLQTRLVGLEHVAHAYVLEVRQHDAALEAAGHLTNIVVEATEAGDGGVVDHRALPYQAHPRARVTFPSVTYEPAIVPIREARNS